MASDINNVLIIVHGFLYINYRNCMLLGYSLSLTLTGESGHWGLINSQWSMSVQSWSMTPSSLHQTHQPEASVLLLMTGEMLPTDCLLTQSVWSFSPPINSHTQHFPPTAPQHWNHQVNHWVLWYYVLSTTFVPGPGPNQITIVSTVTPVRLVRVLGRSRISSIEHRMIEYSISMVGKRQGGIH